ncbi:MAG: hypothetical protein QOH49_4126 [Acidobacteriota bacterium]|jgi:hypothetical protein|nr:hypothetical protein [Acidobacteriota bacterium]
MFNLNATLDNLIAMVVVLLALSLVVQAVQSAVKKMFKLKSRQIEDSLAHLFQLVIDNETSAQLKTNEMTPAVLWARKWKGFTAIIAQSPFLRIFLRFVRHPAEDKNYKHAAAVYNEVLNKFRGIGRTALSTRPIFDSMSKGDLMKVVANIEPAVLDNEFATKVTSAVAEFKKFYVVFDEWKEWFGGPDFKAAQYLGEDDRAKLAELQAKFKPLVDDLKRLLAPGGDPAEVVKAVAADIVRLRSLNLGDAQKVLDDVRVNARHAAERARLGGKPDVANVLDLLVGRLDKLAAGFADFQKAYNAVFARWVKLEESFDSVMQSFEERYARSMKTAAIIISFLVVAFLNASFFNVYETISTSDAKREMIIQSRQQVVDALAHAATSAPAADPAARDAQTQQTIKTWFDTSRKEVDEHAAIFTGYGFQPITLQDFRDWGRTWRNGDPWTNTKHDLKVLLGWLIMALLLSVGAPFWQDFLESLFGVKNVLRKRSETQNVEQASGAGQTKQA